MQIQWHQVFDEALRRADVIAVARVAAMYLDRPPTRSELSAARRSASSYARASNTQVLHVTGATSTRISRNILLLARTDADLDDTEGCTLSPPAASPRRFVASPAQAARRSPTAWGVASPGPHGRPRWPMLVNWIPSTPQRSPRTSPKPSRPSSDCGIGSSSGDAKRTSRRQALGECLPEVRDAVHRQECPAS